MSTTEAIGSSFAQALAEKDSEALRGMLHEQVDFRALTPRQAWEADDADGVLEILLGSWFEDSDEIRSLDAVETGEIGDRERLRYRMRVGNADGEYVVEQQGFLSERDGRIAWLRLLCSGFMPI